MFNRVCALTAKACYAGLYLTLFGWLLSAALPAAESWWIALAVLILVSPLAVLIGNFVIGPLSWVAGVAAGTLTTALAALIRVARS